MKRAIMCIYVYNRCKYSLYIVSKSDLICTWRWVLVWCSWHFGSLTGGSVWAVGE